MPPDIYKKKLEQIFSLLEDLDQCLSKPLNIFLSDKTLQRAAERNFQLIVNLAIDINSYLILERSSSIPDTYRQSFLLLADLKILTLDESRKLSESAQLRNILVHDYDFDVDSEFFYKEACRLSPLLRNYANKLVRRFNKTSTDS